jgi:tetratricopeptide (TPR) repeat protein
MAETTLFKALLHRRVPQILGLYLGASWIAIEFSNMIAERYALSQTLVDFLLVLLASFVPTVLMLAWFHGAPGRDEWTRVEKIGIPLNVLLSILLLTMLFRGQELGATTTTVTVTNEDGQQIEHVLAKPELRRRIAVFFLDNRTGDPALDWLQYGLAVGIAENIGHSLFASVWTPYEEFESRGFAELAQAGYPDGLDAPRALMRSVAEKKRMDLFVTGAFESDDGISTLRLEAYATEDGREIFSGELTGPDVLVLADQLRISLAEAIGLSAGNEGRSGLAERAVDSREALRLAVLGLNAEHIDNDLTQAVAYWEQAVALEPGFAAVHIMLAKAIVQLGDIEGAAAAVRRALQHDYRLSDDDRFIAKGLTYSLRGEQDKAIKLYEMWVELYPENALAHKYLAAGYEQLANRAADALVQLQAVRELDPEDDRVLLWMGRLHEILGELEMAIADYEAYAQTNPEEPTALIAMGAALSRAGRFDDARQLYERAEILDPELVTPVTGLADIALREGRYEDTRRHLENAESIARIPQHEAEVIRGWIAFHEARGEMQVIPDLVDRLYGVSKSFMQPINLLMLTHVEFARTYAWAGETDRGQAILERLRADFEPPLDALADVGMMMLWTAAGNRDAGLEYTERVDNFLRGFGQQRVYYVVDLARAQLAALAGELSQAIAHARSAMGLMNESLAATDEPADRRLLTLSLADYLLRSGELEEARDILAVQLAGYPADPIGNLRLAQLELMAGHEPEARAALGVTLTAWAEADADYAPAITARALAADLGLQ